MTNRNSFTLKVVALILLLLSVGATVVAIEAFISGFCSIRYALTNAELMKQIVTRSVTGVLISVPISTISMYFAKKAWKASEQ